MSTPGPRRVYVERMAEQPALTVNTAQPPQASGNDTATPCAQDWSPTGVSRTSCQGQFENCYIPHSPRVGEMWRTGRATSHAFGWFRPSPTPRSD